MTFRQRYALRTRHVAEHRQVAVALNGVFQQLEVAIAVDAVDDNARDIQARVEVLEAHHRGGNGGRDRFAVHQQDDRAAQLFRHRRAAAIVGVGTVTIVEAHHAFNDGNIGLLHLFAEQRVEDGGG